MKKSDELCHHFQYHIRVQKDKIIYLPCNDYEIISYSESDILLYEESGKYLSPKLIIDTSLNENEKLNIKGGN